MTEESGIKNTQINARINQIRDIFFNGDNRLFASKIGEKEQNLSSVCSGKRPAALTVISRILSNLTNINANWLIIGEGEMLISSSTPATVQGQDNPYAEELAMLRKNNAAHLKHIELLEEKVSSLEEQLRQEREKVSSSSARMSEERILQ